MTTTIYQKTEYLTHNIAILNIKTETLFGICCFSAKHAALRRKSKDWLTRNQDNVVKWGDNG